MRPASAPDPATEIVEDVISKTPFFDLLWLFSRETEALRGRHSQSHSSSSEFLDFEAFKQSKLDALTDIAASFRAAMDRPAQCEDIELHSEYLVAMCGIGASIDQLVEHYARATELVESDEFSVVDGHSLVEQLTSPILVWNAAGTLTDVARVEIAKELESMLRELRRKAEKRHCAVDWLEMLNSFTFVYLGMLQHLRLGFHPAELSGHLRVFRYCSALDWSRLPDVTRMRFAGLAYDMLSRLYALGDPIKPMLGVSHNSLADARMLFQVVSQAPATSGFMTYQWVYRWLADKIDSDTFSTRQMNITMGEGLRSLSEVEQMTVVELAHRFASYREPITTQRIARFLLQFETTERIRGALRLLSHVKFVPMWDLSAMMERLLRAEVARDPGRKLIVAPLGEQTGSTAIIRYLAAHSDIDGVVFKDDIVSALKATDAGERICFVDDCLLSGTQALSILRDWMGKRAHKPHHTVYSSPLSKAMRKELRKRSLVLAYCIGTDAGRDRFLRDYKETGLQKSRVEVRAGVYDPVSAKAFEPLGPVSWASEMERTDLRNFASTVGFNLLESRERAKKWPEGRRQESALGYSNYQRVLIFPYNVPKTTLTFLWANGDEKFKWMPLFPGFD